MPFPESERVLYDVNTLEEVICQVRFPPVLRVDTEVPAPFQDLLRDLFPMYRRTQQVLTLPPGMPAEFMQAIAAGTPPLHEFVAEDERWKFALARDFLALTTRGYENWRHFRERLQRGLDAVQRVYGTTFAIRTGLRYRNRINRAALGLADAPWGDLIKAPLAGELADPIVGPSVDQTLREVVINLAENAGRVRIVHGVERTPADGTESYVIDADFFTETRVGVEGVNDVLDRFNRKAGRLFRWYVTQKLHDAMGPRPSPH